MTTRYPYQTPARRAARRRTADDASTPGLPARRAALRLLDAVLRRGEPLETALHAATQGLADRADKALAHAIAADVLRWQVDLDALIDSATPQPLPEDAKARMVLRLALVQLLRLETPPHAAIATALPLVDGGPRRLVHGVLGHLLRAEARLPEVPTLPEDVAGRWRGQWGEAMVDAAARALSRRAPIDVTLADPAETAHYDDVLAGETLLPGHVRIDHAVSVPTLPGFREGRWWVLSVEGIGVTQARSLREAPEQARGMIAAMLDIDTAEVDVDVVPELDAAILKDVRTAKDAAEDARIRQIEARALRQLRTKRGIGLLKSYLES